MKYWIYKDARILGPFERDAMSGLPGFDASTLVCAGENAGAAEGQWSPAADIPDLAPLTLAHGPTWSPDAPASSFGLLDKLQIESAGLIGDDQYPSAAEVLFQDAEIKKSFAELLVARTRGDDTEVRRLRGLVSELSVQLELMYRRIAQLENTHTDFLHRLATTEAAPHSAPIVPPVPSASAPLAPAIAPLVPKPAETAAPAPSAWMPVAPIPPASPAPASPTTSAAAAAIESFPTEWPEQPASPAQFPSFSDFKPAAPPVASAPSEPEIPAFEPVSPAPVPEAAVPTTMEPARAPEPAVPGPAFEFLPPPEPAPDAPAGAFETPPPLPLPPLPDLSAVAAASVEAPLPPLPASASEASVDPTPDPITPAARKLVFDKPKTLRIVPTVRSFRVVDPTDPDGPGSASDAAATAASSETPAPAASLLPPMPSLTPPVPAPETVPNPIPPPPAFVLPEPVPPLAAPAPSSEPSFNPSPVPASAAPTFAPEPAAFRPTAFPPTGSLPVAGVSASPAPPATAVFSGGPSFGEVNPPPAIMPATQEVLARLAKPAAPPVSAPARPPRSNKKFLVVGSILAVVTIMVLVLFLRRTRASDLNHMASLDDGKPQLGAEPVDDGARPPAMKPPMAAAPTAPTAPTAPAAPAATAATAAPAAPAAQASSATSGAPAAFPPVSDAAAPSSGVAPAGAAPTPAAPSPLDAATAFVKNFPLDGRRGTVSKWLDFSYMATPDAGQAVWTPTAQSDGTYLVEYHFVPAVHGAPEILYLFEADPDRGYVLGKNRDAQELLAGGAPRLTVKTASKPKPRKRTAAHRRRTASADGGGDGAPRAVPQLPLPSEGELHAPAEDDGDFGSDTVKSDQ